MDSLVRQHARQHFAKMILWSVGMVGIGLPFILLSQRGDMSADGLYAGYAIVLLGALIALVGIYRIVFCPQKLAEQRRVSLDANSRWAERFGQDLSALKLCSKYPSLLFIFSVSVCSIFVFLLLDLRFHWTASWVLLLRLQNEKVGFILQLYLVSFVVWGALVVGYLAMAQRLVRLVRPAKRSTLGLARDYLRAIPLIAVLAALWSLLVLIQREDDESATIGNRLLLELNKISLYAGIVVFKFFIYVNLASVAAGDSGGGVSYGQSKKFLSEHTKALSRIWARSGMTLLVPLALFAVLWLWNEYLHWVDLSWMTGVLAAIWVATVFAALLSEQIAVLVLYLRLDPDRKLEKPL